jgi:hypothetical protein
MAHIMWPVAHASGLTGNSLGLTPGTHWTREIDAVKNRQASHQHFIGSWARLNCENMPVIPAWLVRNNFNDPRNIPYLLVWKDARDGEIMEAVRLGHFIACGKEANDYVELKRTDGSATVLRIVWRILPRNGGRHRPESASIGFCRYSPVDCGACIQFKAHP